MVCRIDHPVYQRNESLSYLIGCQLFTVELLGTQANNVFIPPLPPAVLEKRAPTEPQALPVMVKLKLPSPQVGTVGLVVNLEYSVLDALPDMGWPRTYIPTWASVLKDKVVPAVPVSSSWMVFEGLPLASCMLVAPRMVRSVVLPGLALDMWIRFVIGPESTEPVMLNRTLL